MRMCIFVYQIDGSVVSFSLYLNLQRNLMIYDSYFAISFCLGQIRIFVSLIGDIPYTMNI